MTSEDTFLETVALQEVPLAYTSWALSLLGLVICILIFVVVIKAAFEDKLSDNVWKPRTLFEVFSIISTVIGMLVGNYGIFFTYPRIYDKDFHPNTYLVYAYIFQRFLLIGADLFPSMDRCMAVLYPLKYMTQATPRMAFGKIVRIVKRRDSNASSHFSHLWILGIDLPHLDLFGLDPCGYSPRN